MYFNTQLNNFLKCFIDTNPVLILISSFQQRKKGIKDKGTQQYETMDC